MSADLYGGGIARGSDLYVLVKVSSGNHFHQAFIGGSRGSSEVGPVSYTREVNDEVSNFVLDTDPNVVGSKPPKYAVPRQAVNVTADTTVVGQVTLRWGHPVDGWASADLVRRGAGKVCPKTVVDGEYLGVIVPTWGRLQNSFTDTNAAPGTSHCYSVFALDGLRYPARPASVKAFAPVESTLVGPPMLSSFAPASGDIGKLVKLKGTNLLQVVSVSFGPIPAESFWPVGSTGLDVVVPSNARTNAITVITQTGAATSSRLGTSGQQRWRSRANASI